MGNRIASKKIRILKTAVSQLLLKRKKNLTRARQRSIKRSKAKVAPVSLLWLAYSVL